MEDLARTEYPGMLAHLQPMQATQTLNERVKRINKINLEIADWLQERRRVEEQYALGLRRLTQYRAPNSHSDLGVFQAPWARIIESIERIAHSHHVFAERIEQDVENPLRAYPQRRDFQNMHNIANNLGVMAKDLEDAQDKADKLNRKGNKASPQKVDAATMRLESTTQQWESQAPFVFETLQALDESRINQLRDLLTQYQTSEADQAQRAQDNAVEALAAMLEISTEKEVVDFAQRTTAGRPAAAPSRSSTRRSTAVGPGARPVSSAGAPSPSLLHGATNSSALSDISDVAPPPGPPPAQQAEGTSPPSKDEEGFTIRAPMNDPITEAQREAAGDEADQLFKLSIQTTPVDEEDPQAKEAALSSVVKTLKLGPATRRSSTIRGRRDVRNTVYLPPPSSSMREGQSDGAMPSIAGSPPASSASFPRPTPVAALASEASMAGTSDTQSVRSGNSLGSLAHAKHPDMTGPGLNCSIVETVSAVFDDGVIKSASITGEIAFVNNSSQPGSKPHEIIRINHFPNLERIGPNRIFVQNAWPERPDQFTLDTSHLAKTATAFSYRVFADEAENPVLGQHAPLLLKPAGKPQGDKLGLLLQYRLNPVAQFKAPTTLHNVVLVARYEGRASSAQTKPTGTHLKEKHLVYWRLGDLTLTGDTQKIVCRVVGADGVTPTAGLIEARWEYAAAGNEAVGSGISLSRLEETEKAAELAEDDPFADQSQPTAGGQNWVAVPLQRRLVSGKYEGK
ncbi:fes/CIP4 domain-containing protein [Ophiocordyceps sinensis CO18]|uniref:Fes/CIP4 domain-containing protein n=1 Tax=Ophiocordyceps sinensis (strain Co18 / CGMCC 3.14243) TaxID=911162 RepID=T5AMJ9_OPHSC|nr:fes/CIP4 domain-containing protein [Ophiocordyceps sinensis CO18]